MNRSLLVVACSFPPLGFAVEAFAADRPQAINPQDVATVRAFARGQGALGPPSADCAPSDTSCREHLYITFDRGTSALRGQVDVPIDVQRASDPFTGCKRFNAKGLWGATSRWNWSATSAHRRASASTPRQACTSTTTRQSADAKTQLRRQADRRCSAASRRSVLRACRTRSRPSRRSSAVSGDRLCVARRP